RAWVAKEDPATPSGESDMTARPRTFCRATLAGLLAVSVGFALGSGQGKAAEKQGLPAVARHIDRLLEQRLQEEKVTPSPRSSDAEFLRRVSLDLTGRIPTAERAAAFLDST